MEIAILLIDATVCLVLCYLGRIAIHLFLIYLEFRTKQTARPLFNRRPRQRCTTSPMAVALLFSIGPFPLNTIDEIDVWMKTAFLMTYDCTDL